MANQRISIRCIACGAEKFFAKRSMSAFYTVRKEDWQAEWDDWFQMHEWGFCAQDIERQGIDEFELTFEHAKGS